MASANHGLGDLEVVVMGLLCPDAKPSRTLISRDDRYVNFLQINGPKGIAGPRVAPKRESAMR